MSYDIRVCDKDTCETVVLPEKHNLAGGTFAMGGTDEAWLNVTYNYGDFFYEFMDEDKGIRAIYGKPLKDAVALIDDTVSAIVDKLGDEPPDPDYWKATPGNACKALRNLKAIAEACLAAYPGREMEFQGD